MSDKDKVRRGIKTAQGGEDVAVKLNVVTVESEVSEPRPGALTENADDS